MLVPGAQLSARQPSMRVFLATVVLSRQLQKLLLL
jgi:hypothetical protein